MRPQLSAAAATLLRALVARLGDQSDRLLLTDFRSVDWQSLTFSGERHEIALRLLPPDAPALLARLTGDLGEADWRLPRLVVADVAVFGEPQAQPDGSILLHIEALTIDE